MVNSSVQWRSIQTCFCQISLEETFEKYHFASIRSAEKNPKNLRRTFVGSLAAEQREVKFQIAADNVLPIRAHLPNDVVGFSYALINWKD